MLPPESGLVYDFLYDRDVQRWVPWYDTIAKDRLHIPLNAKVSISCLLICIPGIQSAKYFPWILFWLIMTHLWEWEGETDYDIEGWSSESFKQNNFCIQYCYISTGLKITDPNCWNCQAGIFPACLLKSWCSTVVAGTNWNRQKCPYLSLTHCST